MATLLPHMPWGFLFLIGAMVFGLQILKGLLRTPKGKKSRTPPSSAAEIGARGERKTRSELDRNLPASIYQGLHDIIIPSANGTTQIDHIIVSPYGLFVVETKNMKGWIFGSEKNAKWTQSLIGQKIPFQNPLRQNYRHIQCLAAYLRLDDSCFHSVVSFVGDCTFKTELPENVIQGGVSGFIRSFQREMLNPAQRERIVNALTATRTQPENTLQQHVYSLNLRYASETTCPKCSGNLVQRIAKKGRHIGQPFLACGKFKCRYIKS